MASSAREAFKRREYVKAFPSWNFDRRSSCPSVRVQTGKARFEMGAGF